jgi:ADP-ribosylglycohydrolase/predicted protein tyrosine phosphatase
MKLTSAQLDRAAGVLLGMACGDALGAGYEFGPPLPAGSAVTMKGGGGFNWAPGEWTDDTSMAVPIIRAIADCKNLRDESVLDEIVAAWVAWARTAPDVGNQLRAVLSRTDSDLAQARSGLADPADPDPADPDPADPDPVGPASRASAALAHPEADAAPEHAGAASAVRLVARAHHDRHGRSGGNGSLMRAAPVALAFLDDPAALAEAARAISDLTHVDTDAGDACVLWCLAIRHAVVSGALDVRVGLDSLPADRRVLWEERLLAAEAGAPRDFDRNGWVVEALQGAWSAISEAARPGAVSAGTDTPTATIPGAETTDTPADHLRRALESAVRGGRDTDTVAAIAGGLLGARYGASAVPADWRRIVHGWPGLRADELVRLGVLAARATGRRTPAAGPSPFAGRARRADVAILAGRVSLGVRADDGRGRRDPARPDRRNPATPDSRAPGAPERRDPNRPDRRDPSMPDRRIAVVEQAAADFSVPDRRPRRDRANTTWPAAERLPYATSGDISSLVRHPHDDGVWLGAVGALDVLPAEIDAVVSLCPVGRAQVPERIRAENRVAVWLIDEVDPRANPNLAFVLEDTVDAIAALRAEGRTVLVHCVRAISRTPTIGALYAARHRGVPMERALREVTDALPHANPNATFIEALEALPTPRLTERA